MGERVRRAGMSWMSREGHGAVGIGIGRGMRESGSEAVERGETEVCINQIPLCYIIGYNILRYQALPWHISYQETV